MTSHLKKQEQQHNRNKQKTWTWRRKPLCWKESLPGRLISTTKVIRNTEGGCGFSLRRASTVRMRVTGEARPLDCGPWRGSGLVAVQRGAVCGEASSDWHSGYTRDQSHEALEAAAVLMVWMASVAKEGWGDEKWQDLDRVEDLLMDWIWRFRKEEESTVTVKFLAWTAGWIKMPLIYIKQNWRKPRFFG